MFGRVLAHNLQTNYSYFSPLCVGCSNFAVENTDLRNVFKMLYFNTHQLQKLAFISSQSNLFPARPAVSQFKKPQNKSIDVSELHIRWS